MGRFRKFMPCTAFGMVIAWLAIAGVPPLVGLLLEGRDHQPARSCATTTGSGSSGIVAAVLHRAVHDPPDLAHLLRQRALRSRRSRRPWPRRLGVDEPRRDAEPADRARRADRDPSPTVPYGDAGRGAARRTHRTSRRRIMVVPDPGARRARRRSAGCSTCPFTSIGVARPAGSSRRSAALPEVRPDSFVRRCRRSSVLASRIALVGIVFAYALYHKGLERRRRKIRSTRSSAPIAPRARQRLLLRRRHLAGSSAARCAASRAGSTVWSTRRSSTARSTASARLVARRPRGAARCRTGCVRRYALGIAFGAVAAAPLRRDPGGAVTRGDFPILIAIILSRRSSAR